jgi:lysine N6-hydroxylase
MFPEAIVQVSFLKDLVTLVDPTSKWSFLAFLSAHKRLYRFINANFPRVSRREFNQYLQWVCVSLPSLAFGHDVMSVEIEDDAFVIATDKETIRARNIVLGTGLAPAIPDCARSHTGPSMFHATRFLANDIDYANRTVAVIGGGQTGAEVVNHLLARSQPPREIHWVTRRSNFLALDESAFVNEMFSPGYSERFFGMAPQIRLRLVKEHKLASDGISASLLEQIYRRMYELEFVENRGRVCALHPERELVALDAAAGGGWKIHVRSADGEATNDLAADVVILATGFEFRLAPCMEPLRERLSFDGPELSLRRDFSVEWDGPRGLGIYVQNGAKRRRGIADPNLSLMAWRGAIIANSIAGRELYDLRDELCLLGDDACAADESIAVATAWEQA